MTQDINPVTDIPTITQEEAVEVRARKLLAREVGDPQLVITLLSGSRISSETVHVSAALAAIASALSPNMDHAVGGASFQQRVAPWMQECFGPEISADRVERGDRFLEEALELLQSGGYDPTRIPALVSYVWGRPVGEPYQEVGGVMVTLAAYCLAFDLDMHEAGEIELARILHPEIVEKIRRKQATKAAAMGNSSPLPIATPPVNQDAVREAVTDKDFAWRVPRHATEAMMNAGLYHCSADMAWSDLFTAWHHMVDEAQQDDLALATPPLDNTGLDAATAPKACEKLCSWCAQNNIPCDRQTRYELRALASGDRS